MTVTSAGVYDYTMTTKKRNDKSNRKDSERAGKGRRAGLEPCQWYVYFFFQIFSILLILNYGYVYHTISTSTTTCPTSTTRGSRRDEPLVCVLYSSNYDY